MKKKKRVVSYFPKPSESPICKPCWPSKSEMLGTCLPGRTPELGSPMQDLDASLLGESWLVPFCNPSSLLVPGNYLLISKSTQVPGTPDHTPNHTGNQQQSHKSVSGSQLTVIIHSILWVIDLDSTESLPLLSFLLWFFFISFVMENDFCLCSGCSLIIAL